METGTPEQRVVSPPRCLRCPQSQPKRPGHSHRIAVVVDWRSSDAIDMPATRPLQIPADWAFVDASAGNCEEIVQFAHARRTQCGGFEPLRRQWTRRP